MLVQSLDADVDGSPDMTYSIVASDRATGQVGLAVQSRAFGVGRVVNHVRAGVGAVASQARSLPAHGSRTLAALADDMAPEAALAASLDADAGRDHRQVIVVDATGRTAAHTGTACIAAAGHHEGGDWVVAGNLLAGEEVLEAMVTTAESNTDSSLDSRMLSVLYAAEAAGGDLRGRQSASMVVVGPEHTGDPLVDRLVDLRVDDSTAPLPELERLLAIVRAHRELERADRLLADGDPDAAAAVYAETLDRLDGDPEFVVWSALSLAEADHLDEARGLVAGLHGRPDVARWEDFTRRLAAAGLVADGTVDSWW